LVGDGNDFTIAHMIALLCDENKKATFKRRWLIGTKTSIVINDVFVRMVFDAVWA
jgi:hypothetical protein